MVQEGRGFESRMRYREPTVPLTDFSSVGRAFDCRSICSNQNVAGSIPASRKKETKVSFGSFL